MLILVQRSWSATKPEALADCMRAAKIWSKRENPLVLLGQGDGPAIAEEDVIRALAGAATRSESQLAASAWVVDGAGDRRIVAWLIDSRGDVLLRTPKITPEWVNGFEDGTSDCFTPARFAGALTPLGKAALLPGEDIFAPHLVRAAMLSGAEIILNPALERADGHWPQRQQARAAKAYENHLVVAVSTPSSQRIEGFDCRLPPSAACYDHFGRAVKAVGDEDFVTVDVALDDLRRRRQSYFGNLCVSFRPTLYAPTWQREAESPRAAPKTRAEWLALGAELAQENLPQLPDEPRYDVVLGQTYTRAFHDPEDFPAVHQANIDHALATVRRQAQIPSVRLAVFSEFFLQGTAGSRTKAMWDTIGIPLDGPTFERLGEFAQDNRIYVAGAVLERNPHFPGRFFNTAFLLNDSGDLIHVYRKIQCADLFGGFPVTTPGSVLDRYLDLYGSEGLFPVASTPLGRIATAICFDMNFPELHREFAKQGAQVLCHPTSEPHNIRRDAWENSRQVRAWENGFYVLSANMAGQYMDPEQELPTLYSRGESKVVNFDGSVQVRATYGGACAIQGQIDLHSLNASRSKPETNLVAWDRPVVYAPFFEDRVGIPDNVWPDGVDYPYRGGAVLKRVIERYTREGIFVAPEKAVASTHGEGFVAG